MPLIGPSMTQGAVMRSWRSAARNSLPRRRPGSACASGRAEIAETIRSENAGVDKIVFDVIFPDRAAYEEVRDSGVLSCAAVCRTFAIDTAQISDHVAIRPGTDDGQRTNVRVAPLSKSG